MKIREFCVSKFNGRTKGSSGNSRDMEFAPKFMRKFLQNSSNSPMKLSKRFLMKNSE